MVIRNFLFWLLSYIYSIKLKSPLSLPLKYLMETGKRIGKGHTFAPPCYSAVYLQSHCIHSGPHPSCMQSGQEVPCCTYLYHLSSYLFLPSLRLANYLLSFPKRNFFKLFDSQNVGLGHQSLVMFRDMAAGNEIENCDVMLDCSKYLKNLSQLMVLNSIFMYIKIKHGNLQNV